jgi:hypothetical protein
MTKIFVLKTGLGSNLDNCMYVSMKNKQEFIYTTMMLCRTSTENVASIPGYAYGSRKFKKPTLFQTYFVM